MDSSLDELARDQQAVADLIEKVQRKYTQEPIVRRTKAFIQTRLDDLEKYWGDFSNRHKEIQQHEMLHEDHPYMKAKYFEQVQTVYINTKASLEAKLEELNTKASTSYQEKDSRVTNQSTTASSEHERKMMTKAENKEDEQSIRLKRQEIQKETFLRALDRLEQQADRQPSQAYYQQKLNMFENYWSNITTTHNEIMAHTSATGNEHDDIEAYKKEYNDLEELYEDTIITLQEKLNTLSLPSPIQTRKEDELKLPALKIPTFSGVYKEWSSFHDLFQQVIDSNKTLGKAQKMHYLKSHLTGDAAKLIQHLQIMDSNYDTAWNMLVNRYNNTRLLVNTQLQILLSQKDVPFESADNLRRLHDTTKECLNALNNLKIDTKTWDPIILYILTQKLDKDTHKAFEQSLQNHRELQPLQKFLTFLETKFHALEAFKEKKYQQEYQNQKRSKGFLLTKSSPEKSKQHSKSNTTIKHCKVCKDKSHNIHTCSKYFNMTVNQRRDFAKQNNLCINCLHDDHKTIDCKSIKTCRICRRKHNTLLHIEQQYEAVQTQYTPTNHHATTNKPAVEHQLEACPMQSYTIENSSQNNKVMLATALINVSTTNGTPIILRALLDQGSQATLITENAIQRLKAHKQRISMHITGIGDNKVETARSKVQLTISPRFPSGFNMSTAALVLSKLTKTMPTEKIHKNNWGYIQQLTLADPTFDKPGNIDMILGADCVAEILLQGIIKGKPGSPTAQNTELGWILFGNIGNNVLVHNITCCISQTSIDDQLRKFWEIEELPPKKILTEEEKLCEQIYDSTVTRSSSGNYIVKLPFNPNSSHLQLGDSRKKALARQLHLEKMFSRNKQVESEYKAFMDEYLRLGHMRPITANPTGEAFYLPHHSITKEDSTTTKLRVVFDGSAKTTTGISLNEKLLAGPSLQQDLFTILLRWRKYKYALKADIEKMYRQIQICEQDQKYQRILWRNSKEDPMQEFQLTTVTYGTTSAPYLAIKTLQRIADDYKSTFPEASRITRHDFYVDDLMSGASTLSEALHFKNQLIELLAKGGFHLRKWSSNSTTLLKNMPESLKEIGPLEIEKAESGSIKTLGLHWYPAVDEFKFKINLTGQSDSLATKRSLLSEASRLFDPLGWLSPVTIQAKLMFQELWIEGLDWDQPLPNNINKRWSDLKRDLPILENIHIPRWIQYRSDNLLCELHGFCDASEKAYAAVVYVRIMDSNKVVTTTLLTAKSKVSPIKKKLSLPRLELMGAELLAKLLEGIKGSMQMDITSIQAWSDSTIVLSWIRAHPSKWKTFVANRVSEIQTVTNAGQWHHVKSEDNPADLASRGKAPKELIDNKMWWEGPPWLKNSRIVYPENQFTEVNVEVRKVATNLTTHSDTNAIQQLTNKASSLGKLARIVVYCLRFYENIKKPKDERQSGLPTVSEIKKATMILIRITQEHEFHEVYNCLKRKKNLKQDSNLLPLNPFLDTYGILRVGGRLKHSTLEFNQKHPIILPTKSQLTNLVINQAHQETLHGGAQATLSHLRHQYWIINGLSAVKLYTHRCIICTRINARAIHQQMGNLPKPRITVSKPFNNSGIDYAGPMIIKASKLRNAKELKGYIVVFICLATKAIHLEAVTDLTANAFIAAYRRFVGRRGIPENIYSDNATNFVLANKILQKDLKSYKELYEPVIFTELTKMGTTWNFIPPAAPHFGGLWEAGVKSVKLHLKKTLGDTKLTYEELSTILVQIEACLNSRPLCPISSDPNDLEVLTPGHFLIGSALIAPPSPDTMELNTSTLTRWKLMDRLHQTFWKKWSSEYLTRLQQRPKWATKQSNIKTGDVVLLKDEQLPSTKWALGRITETFPGHDGLTRVVSVYTKNGILKRPITKICPLPINEDQTLEKDKSKEHTTESSSKINNPRNAQNDTETPTVSVNYTKLRQAALKEAMKQRRQNNPTGIRIRPAVGYPNLISPAEQKELVQKRKNKEIAESSPRKKICGINKIMTILFTLLLTPSWANPIDPPVEVKQFEHHPGIYFEDLGRIGLINNAWSIISYYDLTNYWNELLGIRRCVVEIDKLCNITILRKRYCVEILTQLKVQLAQFESTNELLHSRSASDQFIPRQKRSPFNIIGTVANKLFGILDSEYANHIETELEKAKLNENYLLQLIKNQTSILESTVNIVKKDEIAIQEQFKLIIDQIAALTTHATTSDIRLQEQETAQTFNSLAIHTTLVLQHYGRMQTAIMEAVTDLQHGKINPLIITPHQLRSQVALIRSNIPSTLKIPGSDDETELFLYDLMTAETKTTRTKILFNIRIPLISNEVYQLFKLIPLPTLQNQSFVYIQPSSDYLITNLHRNIFYPLSQEELGRCKNGRHYNYLCMQTHPIYNTYSNFSRCELELLNHKGSIPAECELKTMKPVKIWIQLHAANTWIYILDQEYTFTVVCGTQVFHQKLHSDGTIKLRPDCVLRQDSMTISGHNLYTSHLSASFLPSLNLTDPLPTHLQLNKAFKPSELTLRATFGGINISSIAEEVRQLKLKEELPNQLSPHDIHHYSTTYIFGIAISIVLGYLIWSRWSSGRSSKIENKPRPAPRTQKAISSLSLDDFVLHNSTEGEHVQNTGN